MPLGLWLQVGTGTKEDRQNVLKDVVSQLELKTRTLPLKARNGQ